MKTGFTRDRNLFGLDMQYSDLLRKDDLCYLIKEQIAPMIKVDDLSEMVKSRGRSPLCPKTLLLITTLQYLEGLSDRDCVTNLRFRLDWKIALGMELDDQGFHPTTLVKFRNRLIENDKASFAFDAVLSGLIEKGIIKKNKRQRIDSTHVVGLIRELSRLELFHETLRLFFKESQEKNLQFPEKFESQSSYYSSKISTRGISKDQKEKMINEAGVAMLQIVEYSSQENSRNIRELDSFAVLKDIFEQNFEFEDSAPKNPILIPIATGKDHICSPHEIEARRSSKGGKGWTGYKAQVAETIPDNKEEQGFITFVDITDSTEHDGDTIDSYFKSNEENELSPEKVYGDTHYNTAGNLEKAEELNIDLQGPVMPDVSKNSKNPGIEFDTKKMTAICEKGIKVPLKQRGKNTSKVEAKFPKEECDNCIFRDTCKPQPRGKKLDRKLPSPYLVNRREEMQREDFKKSQHPRNGIEGTISGLVRRQKIRRAKYRGINKVNLQLNFAALAANITRLAVFCAA